jgi:hypothetical protein
VCREMDHKELDDRGYLICKSCGKTVHGRSWGHSHNLPKGQYKSLETDPENIAIRCQDFGPYKGCHELLDRCDFAAIKNFKDLDQIMQYRKEHDKVAYNKFVSGLREAGCFDYEYVE